jgi:hypothetical protein
LRQHLARSVYVDDSEEVGEEREYKGEVASGNSLAFGANK